MRVMTPSSAAEMADALAQCAPARRHIAIAGNGTKRLMAGPVGEPEVTISTAGLQRVLQYEPADLTVSVEAGMKWRELQSTLGRNRQMIALDPPFAGDATVGGVIASNSSGPMRRAYGTCRDLVIGMQFATLEGKLIDSGGMVVKNVAGLDMAKLMIGSFGTLAAITRVNFRVHTKPELTRTFLFSFPSIEGALEKRDAILRSVLQPIAIDLLSPVAAARASRRGYVLAVRAGGSKNVLARYSRELAEADALTGADEDGFWDVVRDFTPEFLKRQPSGIVLRLSTALRDVAAVFRAVSGPVIARAGSGVVAVYLSSWQGVAPVWKCAREHGWPLAVEFAPEEARRNNDLWVEPAGASRDAAFAMMKKIKGMFDPGNVLNPLRLYGRI